jgi:hypothetical protein
MEGLLADPVLAADLRRLRSGLPHADDPPSLNRLFLVVRLPDDMLSYQPGDRRGQVMRHLVGGRASGKVGSRPNSFEPGSLGLLRRLKPFEVKLHYTDRHRLPDSVEEELNLTIPTPPRWCAYATWSRSMPRCIPRPSTCSTML